MHKLFGVLVLALVISGCEPGGFVTQAALGTPVTVALNQTVLLDGPVLVTPVRVTEDSRCPAPLQCFWPGQVVVEFNVVNDSGSHIVSASTIDRAKQPQIDDLHIAITAVTPAALLAGTLTGSPGPTNAVPIVPENYRFTLVISRVSGVASPNRLGDVVPVPEGQEATFVDGLTVGFVRVVNDSRCPNNPVVRCISLGEVTIEVRVDNNGRIETSTMRLPGLTNDARTYPDVQPRPDSTASIAGVTVRLLAVEPQQTTVERPENPPPATASFVVTRP